MANQIKLLRPYRWEGLWVFDDATVGLDKEPFVAGADTIIDIGLAEKGIANAERGFLLLFSADPFPGADIKLDWQREETGGNIYRWGDHEGWLCPALLRYFESAPSSLYVQLRKAPTIAGA